MAQQKTSASAKGSKRSAKEEGALMELFTDSLKDYQLGGKAIGKST